MVVTPVWQSASSGSRGNAGHINQFLGTHSASFLYNGIVRESQPIGNATYSSTQGVWWSQKFTTVAGQTTVGSLLLQLSTVGGSPTLVLIPPLVIGIYSTTPGSGLPTGSALTSVEINSNYVYSAPFWVYIPLPISGLTSGTTYSIVTQPVGTSSNYYVWQHSNQTSGAATSPDGITWTTQSFGLTYQVSDLSTVGELQSLYEDSGARTVQFSYNSFGTPSSVVEQTLGQVPASYLQSTRTLTYTNGMLTGVS